MSGLLGKHLGRFRIVKQLGRGGIGVVYKARDNEMRVDVAIKTIPPELAHHREFLRRFQQEAGALMRLHHPHIVGLIDLVQDQGSHYMVLEYVDGPSLSQLLTNGALPPERAQQIALQICDALSHAHEHKVVHRDIKPSNILLTKDGRVKVTDFGIARVLDATLGTVTGQVFGTVQYASPEQVKGLKVDARSDLYSLGVVLYEMVTGRVPFVGKDDMEIAEQHLRASAVPPRELREEIPQGLEGIILRCLEKDRELRYQRAEELAADLRRGDVSEKARLRAGEAEAEKDRRIPVAILGTIAVVLLAALGLFGVVFWPRLRSPAQSVTSSAGAESKPASSPTGMQPVPTASLSPQVVHTVTSRPTSAPDQPVPTSEPLGGKIAFHSNRDLNVEIYVMNSDGRGVIRLTNNPASNRYPSWSPHGTRIAFVSDRAGDEGIYVMNSDGSGVIRLTNNLAWEGYPSWSPDGTRIAFVSGHDGNWEIYAINADGSGVIRLTDNPAWDGALSWSPDGTRIAFQSDRDGDEGIYVMNTDGSGVVRLTNNPAWDRDPSWSPDGTRIAFESGRDSNGEIYAMSADGSGVIRLTDNPAWDRNPSWSPDGTRIAFNSDRDGNMEIYVMNADGSGVIRLTNNPAWDFAPAWSPDGTPIDFHSDRDGNGQIYLMNADGSGVIRLTNNPAWDFAPAWSPGGTPIDFHSDRNGNGQIYLMNADGSGVARLTDNPAADSLPSWSPR